ncbi:hypothetical protein AB0J28_29000 [Streptosporangium canum]|uniref:hypothetical protein n=1 Tax=Streptosporangium canum TaxID=324952 RepID=UPI0034404F33
MTATAVVLSGRIPGRTLSGDAGRGRRPVAALLLACAASRLGLLLGLLVSAPGQGGGGRITAGSFLTALPGGVELRR